MKLEISTTSWVVLEKHSNKEGSTQGFHNKTEMFYPGGRAAGEVPAIS